MHAQAHGAPLALDGLFGWACYLLLGLVGLRAHQRACRAAPADTRALLVRGAGSVAPFVLTHSAGWRSTCPRCARVRSWSRSAWRSCTCACLTVIRVLGAAFGHRCACARRSMALLHGASASPWALGTLNLDTRLWVAGGVTSDSGRAMPMMPRMMPRRSSTTSRRASPPPPSAYQVRHSGARPGLYFVGFAGDGGPPLSPGARRSSRARPVAAALRDSQGRSLLLINDVE
jgi:hypothetical protein